jgi:hypothetical protein
MMLRSVLLLAVVTGAAHAQAVPAPSEAAQGIAAVQRLSWFAGCWRRQAASSAVVVEEHWMIPRAGMSLGVGRTVRGDSLVTTFEQLRLFHRAGRAVYHAEPAGQPPADFEAQSTSDTLVVFENASHDFPQRISYRKHGADSLIARTEGTVRGQARAFEFAYTRTSCS